MNQLVMEAQRAGKLDDRIDRRFPCYLPEKAEVSDAHPALIHAACSVESNKSPTSGRTWASRSPRSRQADIDFSREKAARDRAGDRPDAWVVPIYEFLRGEFAYVRLQDSEESR